MNHLNRLKDLFRELFQLELADLDFGLYRILHLKRQEIQEFIDVQLPKQVEEAFGSLAQEEKSELQLKLNQLAAEIRKSTDEEAILAGGDIKPEFREVAKKVKSLRDQIEQYDRTREALQEFNISESRRADVFNHLISFFSRYYEEGDFIAKRRYGAHESYAIPYSGDEVLLHWANKNQYYVKAAENLKDYAFLVATIAGEFRVRFRLVEAKVQKGDIKGDRLFYFPRPSNTFLKEQTNELIVPFELRPATEEEIEKFRRTASAKDPDQEHILEWAAPRILQEIPNEALAAALNEDQRTEADIADDRPEMPLILKRLRHFTKKQTSDFFIHKDLRGFLGRELEFYLKDRVLHPDDLGEDLQTKRRVIRVVKELAGTVIEFLAQLEEAQKHLFEKKKFVLETSFLIPIMNVPDKLWSNVLENEAQVKQWESWYAIDPKKSLFNQDGEVNKEFLAQHPTLVVDTRNFTKDWQRKLEEALPFQDLSDATDGLLVHGENYQALNFLNEWLRGRVKCFYSDPPYNTSEETFLYKNSYKHSSWLSMMADRLRLQRDGLRRDGAAIVAIDDEEVYRLKLLLDSTLGAENYVGTIVVQSNPRGRGIHSFYATSHDYYLVYGKDAKFARIVDQPLTPEQAKDYNYEDEESEYRLLPFRRSGGLSTPDERPNSEFTLYFSPSAGRIIAVGGERLRGYPAPYEPEEIIANYPQRADIERYTPEEFKELAPPDTVGILPTDTDDRRRVWRWSNRTKILEAAGKGEFVVDERNGRYSVKLKDRIKSGRKPKTVWVDPKYDASSHGTNLLQDMFGERRLFGYPKSIYSTIDALHSIVGKDKTALVVDPFAGSGTTGEAVIRLNRDDGGRRKFVLIEMGDYFDTVLVPRVAKAMFSPEWKDGKPQKQLSAEEAKPTPRIVKVLRLEAYEDSLHNIASEGTMQRSGERAQAIKSLVGDEEYRIRYLLQLPIDAAETTLDEFQLQSPFSYSLEVLTPEGPEKKMVDVVETFNYLYGLRVSQSTLWKNEQDGREYRVVKAKDSSEQNRILVVWRDMTDLDPAVERTFLTNKVQEMEAGGETFDEKFINGDTAASGFMSLDPVFKRSMTEPKGGI